MDRTIKQSIGDVLYGWVYDLFPLCRSITGNGVRRTFDYLRKMLPGLILQEVPSGSQAFDWTVPDEWNIDDGYVLNAKGERIIDFKENNLHIMGYSEPIDKEVSFEELRDHLYIEESQPDAIPFVTSYYKRNWGFCLSKNCLDAMTSGQYRAVIQSTLKPGSLTYGELIIAGETNKEVLLSTYICHPSMANNELSGTKTILYV